LISLSIIVYDANDPLFSHCSLPIYWKRSHSSSRVMERATRDNQRVILIENFSNFIIHWNNSKGIYLILHYYKVHKSIVNDINFFGMGDFK